MEPSVFYLPSFTFYGCLYCYQIDDSPSRSKYSQPVTYARYINFSFLVYHMAHTVLLYLIHICFHVFAFGIPDLYTFHCSLAQKVLTFDTWIIRNTALSQWPIINQLAPNSFPLTILTYNLANLS